MNTVFFVRNNIRAIISIFIGKRISNAYSKIFKGSKGLYDSKPTHRYKARRDYFYNKERKKPRKERIAKKQDYKLVFFYEKN